MPRRIHLLLSAGLLLMFATARLIHAQQSPDELPVIEVTPAPAASADPAETERKIRQALEGRGPAGDADPVLDDILQIIRRDGSLLEGSALDPDLRRREVVDEEDLLRGGQDSWQHRTRAAEALLRAARILSTVRPADELRSELTLQMREEAVRLLTE